MSDSLATPDAQDHPVNISRTASAWSKALRVAGWIVFATLLAAMGHLFYFRGYRALIANSSSSSTVELVRRKILVAREAQTLVLGNSAAAEGFPAAHYNRLGGQSTPAINLGVPSGHMFAFEKILNIALDADIHAASVILVLTPEILTYSFNPNYDFLRNDLSMLKVELSFSDAFLIRHHVPSLFQQLEYVGPIALRPALYTADLRDFAFHPVQRLKDSVFVAEWLNSLTALDNFPEPDNLFQVCQAEPLETLGERLVMERQKPDNPSLADLERVWAGYEGRAAAGTYLKVDEFETGRLARLVARIAAKIPHVFLAPAPYYDPEFLQMPAEYRNAFERELSSLRQRNPAIHVLREFPVDCTLMMDTVHLNRRGGELFSAYLHEQIEHELLTESQESETSRPSDTVK